MFQLLASLPPWHLSCLDHLISLSLNCCRGAKVGVLSRDGGLVWGSGKSHTGTFSLLPWGEKSSYTATTPSQPGPLAKDKQSLPETNQGSIQPATVQQRAGWAWEQKLIGWATLLFCLCCTWPISSQPTAIH